MRKNVTYLLGAGASADAVPTVYEFTNRIRVFVNYLKRMAHERAFIDRTTADFYYSEYNWLLEGIEEHTSPDYFAKFLGQTSVDKGNRPKLIKLKLLLSLFFVFEQSKKIQGGVYSTYSGKGYKGVNDTDLLKPDAIKAVERTIDPRYRVFLQNLFVNPEERTLPDNVNIISWNYDMQIEMAFAEFSKKSKREINNIFPITPNSNNNAIDPSKLSLVKLNGTAGMFFKADSNEIIEDLNFMDESLDWFQNIKLFKQLILSPDTLIEFPHFHFAWENNTHTLAARNIAKGILKTTDTLISIGYSFPSYNVGVDSELLGETNRLRSFILQVRPEDRNQIEKNVKKSFDNPNVEMEFENNLGHFYME